MTGSSSLRPDRFPAASKQTGFTLTELAIALFIISLLLASAFMPLSSQLEVRNIADTRRTMEQVKEALIGFAQMNGRLPCPARGATASGSTDSSWGVSISAGAEQYDSTNMRCYIALGVVPWSTLGVPETDAWGRRLTYRVSPAFADAVYDSTVAATKRTWASRTGGPGTDGSQDLTAIPSPANQSPTCPASGAPDAPSPVPTQSSFALCTLGDIAILTRSEANHAVVTPLATGVPVVIVSHGKNGNGAWQTNGIALASASATTDELANSSGTTTATPSGSYLSYVFYSRNPTPAASTCDDTAGTAFCEFDDIVTMIPATTLVSRMVTAGRLP
jgi:prepilin-type N-terminal cleavage/methylation domain-containing protein